MASQSFEDFYDADRVHLYKFLLSLGATWEEAEDVGQEAYMRLYVRYVEVDEPRTWVRQTAKRLLVSLQRQSAGRSRLVKRHARALQPVEPVVDDHQEQVIKAVQELSGRQREVVAWTLDGFSTPQIAALIGVSRKTVWQHLRAAELTLRTLLDPQGGTP